MLNSLPPARAKTAIDKALLQLKADGISARVSREWFGIDVSKP